jgi:peptidoglycan/xylan/chitin deacetylase (PgdA/CDA1 family)
LSITPQSSAAAQRREGAFVISLDFELYWGVRDQISLSAYRENLLGVRKAIPAILELFTEYDVHATWATVGFLFYRTKQELLAELPTRRPRYSESILDAYAAIPSIGQDEDSDPFHYAPSLIEKIAATPGQEIASHTFSHFYCLEPGPTAEDFRADLMAAKNAAKRFGIQLRSLVFPRNQVRLDYLRICAEAGFIAYRGNQQSWSYDPTAQSGQSLSRRATRLIDSYAPVAADHIQKVSAPFDGTPVNVPSSRFLRPYSPLFKVLEPLRLYRITRGLDLAASTGTLYHLWWHPHNFGANLPQNLRMLRSVLEHFVSLRDRFGMESLSMAEVAAQSLLAGSKQAHELETDSAAGRTR